MNLTIGSIIGIVILFIVIKTAKKFMVKVLSFLAVIGIAIFLMYQFRIGPYASNPLEVDNMKSKYCQNDKKAAACACIVAKIEDDLRGRFNAKELAALKNDRVQYAYIFSKSYQAQKSAIKGCLKDRNAEDALKEFQNDLLPLDNDILNQVRSFFNSAKDKVKEEVEEFKNKKSGLDDRY